MFGKSKKRRSGRWIAFLLLLALLVWTAWENTIVELNTYTILSDRLPESFDGYRIAHVSDLHNATLGENNSKILDLLKSAEPDMIAITGDLVDSRNTDMEVAMAFVWEAVKIAPCYYVTGNHEGRLKNYDVLKAQLDAAGVVVLEDTSVKVTLEDASITILGLQDPLAHGAYSTEEIEELADSQLSELYTDKDSYTVMLFHRPSYFAVYADHGVDLVLAGHMHGGQVRIPFLGGLYTPSHGFFPDYDAGLYNEGDTTMIVSRGLGNSVVPIRFNNPSELILIDLQTE